MSAPDQGWYQDPEDPTQLRWWDGEAWTDHTHDSPPAGAEQGEPPVGPSADRFTVEADDDELLEGLDLGDLQPDRATPTVPDVGAQADAPAPRRATPQGRSLFRSSVASSLASLGAGIGSAYLMGMALATTSYSRSPSHTLLHAEQGLAMSIVVALVAVAIAGITCLYTLQWGLERFAGVTVTGKSLRRVSINSMLGAVLLGALVAVSGMSVGFAVVVSFLVLTLLVMIQLRRGV